MIRFGYISSDFENNTQGFFRILILYLAIYLFLLFLFESYIVRYWGYYGFHWRPNYFKISEGLFLLTCCTLMLPNRIKSVSDTIVHLQLMFPILPMLVLYGAQNQNRFYMYAVVISLLLLTYSRHVFFNISTDGFIPSRLLALTSITISYFFILLVVVMGGWRYLNFNLLEVYQYRRAAAANLPSFFGYILPNISNILLPFSLVLSLRDKKYFAASLSVLASLMMFGLFHHKSVFFAPFLVWFTFYVTSKYKKHILCILFGSITVLTACWFDTIINASKNNIASLFLRRVYFVPANANFGYHDFFSKNPFVFLSNSKISFGLMEYPYKEPYQTMIGKIGGFDGVWANTGWLGTSYMHFGYIGMFLYAVIIGGLLKLIDGFAYTKGNGLVLSLILLPFWSLLISADLPTAMLTHGIILSILMISILKNKSDNSNTGINRQDRINDITPHNCSLP